MNVFILKDMCYDTVDMSVVNIKYFPFCLEQKQCAATFPDCFLKAIMCTTADKQTNIQKIPGMASSI